MYLDDKYMYFIYKLVKKNLIFDEMRNNNNATTLHRGVKKKQSNLKQTRNEIIGRLITVHGFAFPYWALIRKGLPLIPFLIL
jgi:hypothetical protein